MLMKKEIRIHAVFANLLIDESKGLNRDEKLFGELNATNIYTHCHIGFEEVDKSLGLICDQSIFLTGSLYSTRLSR